MKLVDWKKTCACAIAIVVLVVVTAVCPVFATETSSPEVSETDTATENESVEHVMENDKLTDCGHFVSEADANRINQEPTAIEENPAEPAIVDGAEVSEVGNGDQKDAYPNEVAATEFDDAPHGVLFEGGVGIVEETSSANEAGGGTGPSTVPNDAAIIVTWASDGDGPDTPYELLETTFDYGPNAQCKAVLAYTDSVAIPKGASLSVRPVRDNELGAVCDMTQDASEIGAAMAFDISVFDADGNEIQPNDSDVVEVSFNLSNVDVSETESVSDITVYHVHGDGVAVDVNELETATDVDDATVSVKTDGFSYFVITFTLYGNTAKLQANTVYRLSDVVAMVDSHTVNGSQNYNNAMFSIYRDSDGVWYLETKDAPLGSSQTVRIQLWNNAGTGTYWVNATISGGYALPEAYIDGTHNGVVANGTEDTLLVGAPAASITIMPNAMTNPTFTAINPVFVKNGSVVGYQGGLEWADETVFPGDCFSLTYADAALLEDGSVADVIVTYRDVTFATPTNSYTYDGKTYYEYPEYQGLTYVAKIQNNGLPAVLSGNSNSSMPHVGLDVTVDVRIEKDGVPVDGSYYYAMRDIDVSRINKANYSRLYGSSDVYDYTESAQILSGALGSAYIPETDYLLAIENNDGSDANGLWFIPSRGHENYNDPDTFYTGFAVLADAAGFSTRFRSAAGAGQQVQTNLGFEAFGHLYVKKTVIDGTESDGARAWDILIEDGAETAFDGAVTQDDGYLFIGTFEYGTAVSVLEDIVDADNYETSWEIVDRVNNETTAGPNSGNGTDVTMGYGTAVQFTNVRKQVPLTVSKTVTEGGDTERDWEFTLTVYDGGTPVTGLVADIRGWQELGEGVYSFNLKHDESVSIDLPKGCLYSVIETPDAAYSVEYVNESGMLLAETEVAVTNTLNETVVSFDKRDASRGAVVIGATLQILDADGTVIDEWVTDGEPHEATLNCGIDYWLHEADAPDGYSIAEDIHITVAADGTVYAQGIESGTDSVIMYDPPTVMLPETGGVGTVWAFWLGAGAVTVCCARFAKRQRGDGDV